MIHMNCHSFCRCNKEHKLQHLSHLGSRVYSTEWSCGINSILRWCSFSSCLI
uniref:Uncharacterized protein n=1 Tax=Anguilla anguilla TaxID=7936 RepID=A0A0E9TGU8_ANGAN